MYTSNVKVMKLYPKWQNRFDGEIQEKNPSIAISVERWRFVLSLLVKDLPLFFDIWNLNMDTIPWLSFLFHPRYFPWNLQLHFWLGKGEGEYLITDPDTFTTLFNSFNSSLGWQTRDACCFSCICLSDFVIFYVMIVCL